MLTLTVVITVGLGIGATTAIFSAVDAVLLRPLPYAEPGQLAWIYTDAPPNKFGFSVADYLALQAQRTRFEQIAGYTDRPMAFSDGCRSSASTAVPHRRRGHVHLRCRHDHPAHRGPASLLHPSRPRHGRAARRRPPQRLTRGRFIETHRPHAISKPYRFRHASNRVRSASNASV